MNQERQSRGHRIGVDLGGTKIEIASLDDAGAFLLRRRVPTPADDYGKTISTIAALVSSVESELGQARSVGLGVPGAPSRVSGRIKNANSTFLIGRPLQEDVERALGRRVQVANDANCLALSEARDGAAAAACVVFAAVLGTGTGGGIAVGGDVLTGRNAIAGEWGHNSLPWAEDDERPGPHCYCGKYGCLETWLSGPALQREYRAVSGRPMAAPDVVALADRGDSDAAAVFARYESRLARGLAGIVNVLDPDVIVLGGGLSNAERLYTNVPQAMAAYVFSDRVDTALRRAKYGDSSGVRGAAMLV